MEFSPRANLSSLDALESTPSPSPSPQPQIKLRIFNGLDGRNGGQEVVGEDKTTKGAVTAANLNDTNGDGQPDAGQNNVAAVPNKGTDEVDLMKLIIEKPEPDGGGKVTLKKVAGAVKLWEEPAKGNREVVLENNEIQFETKDLRKTLYIEALQASTLRGIEFEVKYNDLKDSVKATAVWCSLTSRPAEEGGPPWCKRGTPAGGTVPDGFPDNPVPGGTGPGHLPEIGSETSGAIAAFRANDGSRYGVGGFQDVQPGIPRIGGRILWEFDVRPVGVAALGVRFDLTRQIERQAHSLRLDGDKFVLIPGSSLPYPGLVEKPNDDISAAGEQRDPSTENYRVYSFDAPSVLNEVGAFDAFEVRQYNFKEWIRMRVDGKIFPDDPSAEEVIGSRCSDEQPWYMRLYLKRGATKWELDTENPSVCAPQFYGVNPAGKSCAVVLGPAAGTSGWTVEYPFDPPRQWKLKKNGSTADPVILTQTADGWEGSWGAGESLEVTVTIRGAAGLGDIWRFGVFKTGAEGGKISIVGQGNPPFDNTFLPPP